MASEQIRILHAFGRMGRGGAETWLMNVLRRMDRERFRFDFLVHRRQPGEFDDEIRQLGSSIHIVDSHRNPARYPADLRAVLARGGYHVMHSHVSHFSGYILLLSRAMGVRGRVAHNHTAVPTASDSRLRTAYKRAMRACIHLAATRGLGCSAQACESLYGPGWRARGKYEVLLYGYDFGRFAALGSDTRAAMRRALGVAGSDLVIGHIGRFVVPKNHAFIVELAAALRGRPGVKLVLVGDGELRPGIEREIAARGLGDMFVLTGQRADIPELLSAFDVMIQPSLWEGFGVTLLEAQAAGVPCVISDRVPDETRVMADRVAQRPLGDVAAWIEAIDHMRARPLMRPDQALAVMQRSPFDIERHVARVERIYLEEAEGAGDHAGSAVGGVI